MKDVSFDAPWGAPLILMTVVCTLMCLILLAPGAMIASGSPQMSAIPPWTGWLLVVFPILALAGGAAFMVRGYVLTDGSLMIKRLGWETRLNLSLLTSATVDPDALRGSIRLFGNGGFFSFTGLYRNKQLGSYRAYATDAKKAVVLRFSNKTVVVTPDDPQRFAAEINPCKPTPA